MQAFSLSLILALNIAWAPPADATDSPDAGAVRVVPTRKKQPSSRWLDSKPPESTPDSTRVAAFGLGMSTLLPGQPGEDVERAEEAEDAESGEVETEDAVAPIPESLQENADPQVVESLLPDLIPEHKMAAALPWAPPDYSNQDKALGYSADTFKIPPGMEDRVAFWKDIYAKYTTDQGVLHDSLNLGIVYEMVDLSEINKNPDLNSRQKHKAREDHINQRRALIEERLRRLITVQSANGLSGEDLRYWKMFEKISAADKFAEASRKGRVRFQLGQKDRFILGIYYSGRYLQEMEKIFREAGLPVELTRLPFVESSFNLYARSRVGASGIWQFMRRTARPYMKVDRNVDERNDPIKATSSAAKFLKMNYNMLESWPLAVTAYNHGGYGMKKVVQATGTRDITKIVDTYSSKTFGFASSNFYACFLAAIEVEREARQLLGDVKWSPPLDHAEIKLGRPLDFKVLVNWFEGDTDRAELFNPHLLRTIRKGKQRIPRGTFVRVRREREALAKSYLSGVMKAAEISPGKARPNPKVQRPVRSTLGASKKKRYRVAKGDTLIGIASQFGVSVNDLMNANNLRKANRIRAGQMIVIPPSND